MRLKKDQMEQQSERMADGRWNDWEWEKNGVQSGDQWEEQNDRSATLCVCVYECVRGGGGLSYQCLIDFVLNCNSIHLSVFPSEWPSVANGRGMGIKKRGKSVSGEQKMK